MNMFVSEVLDRFENREIGLDDAVQLLKNHSPEHKQAKKIKLYIKDNDKKVFSLPAIPIGFLRAMGNLALYLTKLGARHSKHMDESVLKLLQNISKEDLIRITDSIACCGNFTLVDVVSDEGEIVKIELL